jgi:two-component system, response regulator YesN
MIKAIIVEDERLIREGIAEQVPWKELQVDEVRTAENAEAALHICREYLPDIVVSDIRMPGMNGIALCTKLRTILPDAQIIFISGYSDKEYLMSAIDLHAVTYIEKPISLEELVSAVRSAVDARRKSMSEKTNAFHMLLNSGRAGDTAVLPFPEQSTVPGTAFFVAVLQMRGESCMPADKISAAVETFSQNVQGCSLQYMIDCIGERKTAVLFFSDNAQELDELYRNASFWQTLTDMKDSDDESFPESGSVFAGIGTKASGSDGVRLSYSDAMDALKCLAFKGWNRYAYSGEAYTEWNAGIDSELLADFKKSLADRLEQHSLAVLSAVYKRFIDSNSLLTYAVRNVYYTLDDAVEKASQQFSSDQDMYPADSGIKEHAETIQELHAYLCSRVRAVLSCDDMQKSSFIVKRITVYIQKNYNNKMLSVQSIADEVFLTPTYISCLFKKKTGQTISQYIQDFRLRKAEEFLSDPQYKIYQISGMVGYEDAHYFARLFKKQTGLKPSDFRAQAE